jgi:hypothetical protein
MAALAPDRNLLFGLLTLQNGLINQGQLVAAIQAWTLDNAGALADHLVGRGDLDADDRSVVDLLVAHHLKKSGGDADRRPPSRRGKTMYLKDSGTSAFPLILCAHCVL